MEFFTRSGNPILAADVMQVSGNHCTYKFQRCCGRCGGLGGSHAWAHTGWTCYECGGVGRWMASARGYTAERLAQLNAMLEKRRAKAEEARRVKAEAEEQRLAGLRAAFKAEHGEVVGWLEANAKGDDSNEPNFAGSLLQSLHKWGSLKAGQLQSLHKWGPLTAGQLQAVEAILVREREQAELAKHSRHLGAVKERITVTLTVERVLDWSYGSYPTIYRYCNLSRDEHGNRVKYVGSKVLEAGTYKATIKELGEYKGELETTIERPKAVQA